jgi:hypothetical protein
MLAVTVRRVCSSAPSVNGCCERVQQAPSDQLGAGRERELLGDHDELVAAEAPERVDVADHAVEPGGDRAQQLVADAVTERVVDGLEVVEVDEQRRHRRLAATRACEHLRHAIQDQGPVGKAGERIVRGEERELPLAPLELLVGALALALEALAHLYEAELQAQLHDVQRL